MSNDDEANIASIIAQLQELQLQQSVLLTRLATIHGRNTEGEYFDASADTPRDFQLGDRVRILNPNRFQPRKGVIVHIGEGRITVQAPNRIKVQRAPNNLVLEN
jgi:hypothetical protein